MRHKITFLLLTGLFALCFLITQAASVSSHTALALAKHVWSLKAPSSHKDIRDFIFLQDVYTHGTDTLLFVFGYPSVGFVLVSGEDKTFPLIGYSFESGYEPEQKHFSFSTWIDFVLTEIRFAKTEQYTDTLEANRQWKALLQGTSFPGTKAQDVAPLLLTKWDQGVFYNGLCPEDENGPGGRVYAGCVATMMAQLINYYKYPLTGIGQQGYYSDYGYLSVNFAQSNYDYYTMPNQLNGPNVPVAKLIYDCGVAVSMGYSPNGSGAFMMDARDALVQHFGFQNQTALMNKGNFSQSQWIDLVKNELENKRPIAYSGYPSNGSGHAFVLDGYQQGDFFHFNWGWSGSYDGYFLLTSLSPGGYNFSSWQSGIMNAFPAGSYPSYCTGNKTITGTKGVIFDGSAINSYSNNSECSWLLSPNEQVSYLSLTFNRFSTEQNADYLIVYAGPDTNAPVEAIISGDTLHPPIILSGPSVLLRFISNDSITHAGFDISYAWALQLYCTGTSVFNNPTGVFSDGSGSNLYREGSLCKWLIEPAGAQSIILNFNEFDTEDGIDLLRVYNPTVTPSALLASYSGSSIPPSLVSNSSSLLLIFQTNQSINGQGWEASYTSTPLSSQEQTAEDKLILFPIPAKEFITLAYYLSNAIPQSYTITDAFGRICLSAELKTEPASGEFSIPLHELRAGMYFLDMETNTGIIRRKFMVQK